jgi:hypothetical protein
MLTVPSWKKFEKQFLGTEHGALFAGLAAVVPGVRLASALLVPAGRAKADVLIGFNRFDDAICRDGLVDR